MGTDGIKVTGLGHYNERRLFASLLAVSTALFSSQFSLLPKLAEPEIVERRRHPPFIRLPTPTYS